PPSRSTARRPGRGQWSWVAPPGGDGRRGTWGPRQLLVDADQELPGDRGSRRGYLPASDSARPVSASNRWARSRSTATDMGWPGVPVTVGLALTLSISAPTLTST